MVQPGGSLQTSDLTRIIAADRRGELERLTQRPVTDAEAEAITGLIVAALLEQIVAALRHGGVVVLRRFGRFELHRRKAQTMRNPITGLPLDVPARSTVGFAPADALKVAVRSEEEDADVQQHPSADATGEPS